MDPRELFEGQFPSLYRYFYYRNVPKDEVEDLVQETFLRFFNKYTPDKCDETECRKILYGIARILYIEWVKQAVHSSTLELETDFPSAQANPDDEPTIDEYEGNRELLYKAIESLNPTLRDVICMRFLDGMSRKEIADRLGIKEKHVHVYQRRGIEMLRKKLSVQ